MGIAETWFISARPVLLLGTLGYLEIQRQDMIFVPKNASLASFTESIPALDSPLRLRCHLVVFTRPCLLISLEEREVVLAFWQIGSAIGKPLVVEVWTES